MTKAEYELPNGLTINAETPKLHAKPDYCRKCRVFYYVGGHQCLEENNDTFKRSLNPSFNTDDNNL